VGASRSTCDGCDSLEAALRLATPSDLFKEPLARNIHALSEVSLGEIVAMVTRAAAAAAQSERRRIMRTVINDLHYIQRRSVRLAQRADCCELWKRTRPAKFPVRSASDRGSHDASMAERLRCFEHVAEENYEWFARRMGVS